ncbi:MAG: hypothetical protein VXW15_09695 [Bdellovibrionota bacterium]|nr:hypothetical protein [Bdellovibrionota bacterium]
MKSILKTLVLFFLLSGCASQMNPRTNCYDSSYIDEESWPPVVHSKGCTLTIY